MSHLSVESERGIVAVVAGTPVTQMPGDLFIPPDALEVLLDSFSGPLDLLLYLIRRQNIDILDIPITLITRQYMLYIGLMKERSLELAADYLVMAAVLAEIKSKMLLPAKEKTDADEPEDDPRMTLIKRLQAYETFKELAQLLDTLPRCGREIYPVAVAADVKLKQPAPDVELGDLQQAIIQLFEQRSHLEHHQINRESLSVRERMSQILDQLAQGHLTEFSTLYSFDEGRMGVVVSFLAILELAKQSLLSITQPHQFSPIHIKAVGYG